MKILDESTLSTLKTEIENNIELYQQAQPFMVERLEIDHYENLSTKLNLSANTPAIHDIANTKILHQHFKDIPIELASEESFWAYLAHVEFWEYMQVRWPLKSENDSTTISSRYFLGENHPLFRQGISRLWWYGHLTYEPTLEDPYHYTNIALKDQDRARMLIETGNVSRNRKALLATLNILHKLDSWEDEGIIKRIPDQRNNLIRPLMRFINAIGGVMIWDLLTIEEAEEKIMSYVNQLIEDDIIVFKNSQVLA